MAAATWLVASWLAPAPAPLSADRGPFDGDVLLAGDVVDGRFGPWAMGEIAAGSVLVDFEYSVDAGRGDVLTVDGMLGGEPGTASGRPYGAVLTVRELEATTPSGFLPHRAGRLIATRVEDRLRPFDDGRALLAGFLIGETSRISESDIESMRQSGLAHFVAVSGSNVALFLGLLAVAAGPLALGPRRRALVGLAALPIYVAATRFEPSVMRASVMAGLALAGRLANVVLEAWQLLSLAVIVLVVSDPVITTNVGFQLSVAATAGVLVGARWPATGVVARALYITLGAQLAVAPLLLIHFGSVPLLSPVVNLIAAPIVTASTVTGALGVAGLGILIGPASWLAGMVLGLARGAAPWPQLTGWELVGILAFLLVIRFAPGARPLLAVAGSALLVTGLLSPVSALPPAGVVVFDVGQGDAILVHGGDGHFALVDGGPDESVVADKLNDYRVRSLELVVLTHVHADHATGLSGIVDQVSIEEVWASTEPHSTPVSRDLMQRLDERGIPVDSPSVGTRRRLGSLELLVEGPQRRYASPNDQSIVLTVGGPTRSVLLAGDIETHAQADLGHLRAEVLKVPHQGAATSDPGWLAAVSSEEAIVSVGPNQFGHPADWVIDLLEETNDVRRTDEEGDVVVDLTQP